MCFCGSIFLEVSSNMEQSIEEICKELQGESQKFIDFILWFIRSSKKKYKN